MAQTTQFTAPGLAATWTASSGYLGGNRNNGSYVSLKSPNNSDYSTIIETMDATAAQTLNFTVTGGLSTGPCTSGRPTSAPATRPTTSCAAADITPVGRQLHADRAARLRLHAHHHDRAGQGHRDQPRRRATCACRTATPSTATRSAARRSTCMDMQGSFEVAACGGGRAGQCVRQMSRADADHLDVGHADPYTLLGDLSWSNYTVSSDVLLEKSGYAQLIGPRQHLQPPGPAEPERLPPAGHRHRRLVDPAATTPAATVRTLASGTVAGPGHRPLAHPGADLHRQHASPPRSTAPPWARSTDAHLGRRPGRLRHRPGRDRPVRQPVHHRRCGGTRRSDRRAARRRLQPLPGRANGASQTDGTNVQIWDCNGGANQQWTAHVQQPAARSTAPSAWTCPGTPPPGTRVQIWTCNGGANQQWRVNADGTIVGVGVRAVPGRHRRRHGQRHRGAALDLQRRQQPVMDPQLTV